MEKHCRDGDRFRGDGARASAPDCYMGVCHFDVWRDFDLRESLLLLLLLFGLSTAVMFAVMSRLITERLHLHVSQPFENAAGPKPAASRRE
jgi:hypothetical protein